MPPPPPLPTPQAFLESLLNNLPTSNPATTTTPLPPTSKPPLLTLHALFPTLLLPALDLLDRHLLTRFIPKTPPNANAATTTTANPDTNNPQSVDSNKNERRRRIIYYALSTTTTTTTHSRHSRRPHDPTTSYEIRPHAWSCTCPAFAFAAYNNAPSASSPLTYEEKWNDDYWTHGKPLDSGNVNKEDDDDDDDAMLLDIPAEEAVRDDNVIGTTGTEHGRREWWGGLMRVEGEEVPPLCKHLLACVLAERWGVVGGMVEERGVGREEMAGWAAGWGG